NGRLIAAYMTDADLLPKGRAQTYGLWHHQLAQSCHTRIRAEGCTVADLHTLDAASHRLEPAGGDGWLAIGDAALSVDPLSSQGLCSAMATGMRAANVIGPGGQVDPQRAQAYEQWLDQTFND